MSKETVWVELTRNEALVLKLSIQGWIDSTSKKRMWPWRKLGWVDTYIYSREVYADARDKMDDALNATEGKQ